MFRWAVRNMTIKLLALVMAVVTWFIVQGVTSRQVVVEELRLEVAVPDNWAVREKKPDVFTVTFRGTKEDVLRLDTDNVRLEVRFDRSMLGEGSVATEVFDLSEKHVIFPGSARVASIEPAQVQVILDDQIEKRIQVEGAMAGELPPGVEIEKLSVEPAAVVVRGSRQRLENIDLLQTEAISLAGRLRSFEQRVAVQPPGNDFDGRIDPARVLVKVHLTEQVSTRLLEDVPLRVLRSPDISAALHLEPAAVTITLQGAAAAVNGLEPDDLRAFVDVNGFSGEAERSFPIRVSAPEHIEVIDIDPAAVIVIGQP